MSRSEWDEKFSRWAAPPGKTEQDRCENAARVVRAALDADDRLKSRSRVFLQGSYRNNTNVRADSDVDVGIVYTGGTIFTEIPNGTRDSDFNLSPSDYTFFEFKSEVERALVNYFGRAAVTRGNKAFDISENSYRVEADVAPFFEHRRYDENRRYQEGVELRSDTGQKIVNWPEQHYNNGVNKNNNTGRRYKHVIRALKSLRNDMNDAGYRSADPMIGFYIECLIWNVPNARLSSSASLYDNIKASIVYLFEQCEGADKNSPCDEWGEVSDLKYLFRNGRDPAQVSTFMRDAWNYVGF